MQQGRAGREEEERCWRRGSQYTGEAASFPGWEEVGPRRRGQASGGGQEEPAYYYQSSQG